MSDSKISTVRKSEKPSGSKTEKASEGQAASRLNSGGAEKSAPPKPSSQADQATTEAPAKRAPGLAPDFRSSFGSVQDSPKTAEPKKSFRDLRSGAAPDRLTNSSTIQTVSGQTSFKAEEAIPRTDETAESQPAQGTRDPRATEIGNTAQAVLDNFALFDSGTSSKDGRFNRADIERVAADSNAPQAAREAAQRLIENQNLLNIIDLGDGNKLDRKFSAADLQNVIATEQAAPQNISVEEAAARIRDNFAVLDTASGRGGRDNAISQGDLTAALTNPNVSDSTKEAIRAVLNNQNYANALDLGAAHGGEKDRKIGLIDAQAAAERGYSQDASLAADPVNNLEFQRAAVTLATNFSILDTGAGRGSADGNVSRDDIAAIANSSTASPELKAAAQLLQSNPALLNAIDVGAGRGSVDGSIRQADLLGFVTTGLENAKANVDKINGQFERFVAENGAFIDPAALARSPEAARVQAANAGLEQFAQNFATLYSSPDFKTAFPNLPEDLKIETIQQVANIAGTQAGSPLADRVVEQTAAGGSNPSDPVAEFLLSPQGRSVVRGGRTELLQSLNVLSNARQFRGRSATEGLTVAENFLQNTQGPEVLNSNPELLNANRQYAQAVDHVNDLKAHGGGAAEIRAAESLAGEARTKVAEQVRPVDSAGVQRLTSAALVLDAYALASHDWGEDKFKDVALVSSSVQDVLTLSAVRNGIGRAITAVVGGEATSATAFLRARAIPALGAVASFSSAFAEFRDGDVLGGAADSLTGIGFSVLAVTGGTGVGAIAGGVLVGVGTAVKIGQAVHDYFSESEAEKLEAEYQNFSRTVLSQVYSGDPRAAQDVASLSTESRQAVLDYAVAHNVEPREAYQMLRNQALAANQSVNGYLEGLS